MAGEFLSWKKASENFVGEREKQQAKILVTGEENLLKYSVTY